MPFTSQSLSDLLNQSFHQNDLPNIARSLGLSSFEMQLFDKDRLTDVGRLSEPHIKRIVTIRNEVPLQTGMVAQRVFPKEQLETTLQRHSVATFVARYSDTGSFTNSKQFIEGLGLNYSGTKFRENESVYVIRFYIGDDIGFYRIPYGGQTEEDRSRMSDLCKAYTKEPAGPPFTGHGFTSFPDFPVPEFYIDPYIVGGELYELRDGDEMYEIDPSGNEKLYAVYRKNDQGYNSPNQWHIVG